MSYKRFCDDCNKQVDIDSGIKLWTYSNHPLANKDYCDECFAKHWKPALKIQRRVNSTQSI